VPGWGDAKVFAKVQGQTADIGVDGKGAVSVLLRNGGAWQVHRFDKDGKAEAVFATELPIAGHPSMSVDADGNCVLSCLFDVEIRDRSGRRVQSWKIPYDRAPSDAALLPDGRIVFCFPNRGTVEIFSRDGHFQESLVAAGDRLVAPTGVAIASDGTIVIVEETGLAHVFRNPVGTWAPAEVATFRVAYPEIPFPPDLAACAFDGATRVLFPHRSLAVPLVYDLKGRRLMASAPERDLSAKGLTETRGFSSTRDALYALDATLPAIIRVVRP
jgi:sugar lactone lactonase YvrE